MTAIFRTFMALALVMAGAMCEQGRWILACLMGCAGGLLIGLQEIALEDEFRQARAKYSYLDSMPGRRRRG